MEEISLEELKERLRKEMEKIDDVRLYYTLRQHKVRSIRALEYYKACIVLGLNKLPITVHTVAWLLDKNPQTVLWVLHRLGDVKVLVLKRKLEGRLLEWIINPLFMKKILGEENVESRDQNLLQT